MFFKIKVIKIKLNLAVDGVEIELESSVVVEVVKVVDVVLRVVEKVVEDEVVVVTSNPITLKIQFKCDETREKMTGVPQVQVSTVNATIPITTSFCLT